MVLFWFFLIILYCFWYFRHFFSNFEFSEYSQFNPEFNFQSQSDHRILKNIYVWTMDPGRIPHNTWNFDVNTLFAGNPDPQKIYLSLNVDPYQKCNYHKIIIIFNRKPSILINFGKKNRLAAGSPPGVTLGGEQPPAARCAGAKVRRKLMKIWKTLCCFRLF